mgnify:CR=1 FL=1|jgi:hypothetical protein
MLGVANLPISMAIAWGYLQLLPNEVSFQAGLFLASALTASLLVLNLVPTALAHFAAGLLPRKTAGIVVAFCFTLFDTLLYSDTRIFALFRFHFNGHVWNALSTPGAGDSIDASATTSVVLPILGLLIIWFLSARLWKHFASRPVYASQSMSPFARPVFWWLALALPAFALEKGLYAFSVSQQQTELSEIAHFVPAYLPLRLHLDSDDAAPIQTDWDLIETDQQLRYPKSDIQPSASGARPNIVILVSDALRADMLAQDTMPKMHEWAKTARNFTNHLSGGNGTRMGLFSLFYGLHGSYWAPFLAARKAPVLLDILQDLDYQTLVLASASQLYPEFRSTLWVNMPDSIEDQFTGPKYLRDQACAERFDSWLETRDTERPFFSFTLLDATHLNYSFPEDAARWQPYSKAVDFHRLSYGGDAKTRIELFNRYRNAVDYADGTLTQMLQSLESRGLSDNTIVIITGDHGEEMFEHGFWGHNSNFLDPQTQVPFLMKGPGIASGVEHRPTSHTDLARTLLETLGVPAAKSPDYNLGVNLLTPLTSRKRVCASWGQLCVRLPDGLMIVPIETFGGGVEFRDLNWDLMPQSDALMVRESETLERLLADCREFLQEK